MNKILRSINHNNKTKTILSLTDIGIHILITLVIIAILLCIPTCTSSKPIVLDYISARIGDIKGADAISIANTYIVYTTVLFSIVTSLIILISLFIAFFLQEKKSELHDRVSLEILSKIEKDEKFSNEIINSLMRNNSMISDFTRELVERSKEIDSVNFSEEDTAKELTSSVDSDIVKNFKKHKNMNSKKNHGK